MYKHANCGGLLDQKAQGKYRCRVCRKEVVVGKPTEADFKEADRKEDEFYKAVEQEEITNHPVLPDRRHLRGVKLIR